MFGQMFMKSGRRVYDSDGFVGLILFLLALLPRVLPSAGVFLNVDAAGFWLIRTKGFLLGLTGHGLSHLVQSGHPGVTLMWLMSGPEALWQKLHLFDRVRQPLTTYIELLKLPEMLVTSLLVVVVWLLLRRIVDRPKAVIIATIFALDPLYLIYSRYLHLDALLTGFIFVGLLSLWLAMRGRDQRYAILAGAAMALAVLTRLNAGVAWLFGLVVILFWTTGRAYVMWRIIGLYLGSFVLTAVIVWPAILFAPAAVGEQIRIGLLLGLSEHEVPANVDTIPYVRALLFPLFVMVRDFPLVILLGAAGLTRVLAERLRRSSFSLYTAIFTVVFLAGVMLGRKHLDRYFLPGIIGLSVFAADGLRLMWDRFQRWRSALAVTLAAAMVIQLVIFYRLQPYYQTYVNSLGTLLQRTPFRTSDVFAPTWGEGLPEAAAYLRQREGRFPRVATWFPTVLCVFGRPPDPQQYPFWPKPELDCPDGLTFLSSPQQAEYLILSRGQLAQNVYPRLLDDIARLGWQPVYTAVINGQPFAWVYRNTGGLAERYRLADD